jgi:hypothetical protein
MRGGDYMRGNVRCTTLGAGRSGVDYKRWYQDQRERERERERRERERGREGEIIRDNVNHYTKPACQLLTPQPAFYCYGAKPRQRCVTDVMAQGK